MTGGEGNKVQGGGSLKKLTTKTKNKVVELKEEDHQKVDDQDQKKGNSSKKRSQKRDNQDQEGGNRA